MKREKTILCSIVALTTLTFTATSYLKTENQESILQLQLANVESLTSSELGCISKTNLNDGDCVTDGIYYFCENSWVFDDCVKGEYPL